MNKTWIAIAAMAIPLAAAPAASADNWSRSVDGPIEAATLGLPADAPAQRLGKAAIAENFRKLGDVRFARTVMRGDDRAGATPMQGLRFRQTLGGLRVLWSEIDVAVTRGAVQSISGTVVPLKSRALAGKRRVSAGQARAIARKAVPGAGIVRPAEFIAYAGEPGKPRAARRAYVVEVYRKADRDEHSENALCVVVDAESGRVRKTWEGFAAREPESGGRRRARAAAT